MNFRYKILIPLALTAALLFTACSVQKTTSASMTSTASAATSAQTTALSATGSETEDTTASELFSKRDLSGDYDAAEAAAVTLTGSSAQADSDAVRIEGSTVTITAAGTYVLTGTLDDGSIIVDADKLISLSFLRRHAEA